MGHAYPPVTLTAGGLVLMSRARTETFRGLGSSLISGAVVTFALFLVQLLIDDAKEQAARDASHAADVQKRVAEAAARQQAVLSDNPA